MDMDNLIERDTFILRLQQRCAGCDNREGSLCIACEVADMIDAVEDAPVADQWTACIDALPEHYTAVLMMKCGSGIVIPQEGESVEDALMRLQDDLISLSIGYIGSNGWYDEYGRPMPTAPTYWMPVPPLRNG